MSNLFDKEKSLWKLENLLETRIETKKNILHSSIQLIAIVKSIYWIQKNNDKNGKALYKLMNNALCKKTMENLRNRIDAKLMNNENTI